MSSLNNPNSDFRGSVEEESPQLVQRNQVFTPPPGLKNPVVALETSLDNPHGYPPLSKIFTPTDQVVLVLDDLFCTRPDLLEPILDRIVRAGLNSNQLTFLVESQSLESKLLETLPERFEEAVITVHEPGNPSRNAIVAISATGQRISFARVLSDADQVVVAGYAGKRAHQGFVGGSHQLWPGMAERQSEGPNKVSFTKSFRPDFSRDDASSREACWLLGAPFFIMALPGKGGIPSGFISGSEDALNEAFKPGQDSLPGSMESKWKVGLGRWTGEEPFIPFDQMVDTACRLAELLEPGSAIHLDLGDKAPSPDGVADLRLGGHPHGDTMARLWTRILAKNQIHLWGKAPEGLAKALAVIPHVGKPDVGKDGPWLVLEDGYWG